MIKSILGHPVILTRKDIKESKSIKTDQRGNPIPKSRNWKYAIGGIWSLMEGNRLKLTVVIVSVIISSLLGLVGPYMIGQMIDNKILKKNFEGIENDLLILFFIFIGLSLFSYVAAIIMVTIAQETVYKLRMLLFSRLQKLPIPFFDKRQHGELMSRMTNDIDTISQVLNSSFIQFTSSIITIIGTIIVMLLLSPLLTLLTMMIIPLMLIAMRWITNRTSILYKRRQRAIGEMNGYIEEIISGQEVVKLFTREARVTEGFTEKNAKVRDISYWSVSYSGLIPKVMNFFNNLSFAIVAGIGGVLALNGNGITVGTIVIFAEYARQFTRPLNDLANQFNTVLSALSGAERVFEIIDTEPEVDIDNSNRNLTIRGEISFEQVTFKYNEEQLKPTINDVTIHLNQGESLALVGATGAGKTTLVQLLARFYEINAGKIMIDGIDIKDIPKQTLRNQMAYVLQDPFIFDGTIRENIKYRNQHVSDEVMIQAAKDANAYDFIMRLENGFDTEISFESTHLSQGEKQLVNIARALILDPKILLLDEATSNIDTVTEMKLQQAIERLMKNRTSIIIAHRLNTVKKADKIVVLEKGEILEQGYQKDLITRDGIYAEMLKSGDEALLE
ncbi:MULTISPECIES: ABC transporter ATP-binding protein [Macrococcus]|uniref:ABC transporter ATP-binding protein n=1 Tax=Macrococcus psychrotolerans TaxID=3039389 RepID=A0AAT9P7V9_9STAP|nr:MULTISPECIES: ABC transporter ATP-binding protein [Macrococcus]MDJ1110690.1 ABC transporter ATP-binding protein [Macrococcus sp. S115]QYA33757.1 ABC transporter ATP-binding protein/permease [Macrococcus sp. 19Msa1099]QYA38577.1 ABC transporter ATP-binding protein/permease [Macrococcus caseolyticus]QYA77284.1 ABC transporter ATP-binding protein/permease [Macrococcus caseolyticus]